MPEEDREDQEQQSTAEEAMLSVERVMLEAAKPEAPKPEQAPRKAPPKPDYGRFATKHRNVIESLLAYPLDWNIITRGFDPNYPLYFVTGYFLGFAQSMDAVFKVLQKELPPPRYPSKDCIRKLVKGRPLSCFEILRLHLAFEFLRNEGHPIYGELVADPMQRVIEAGSIIPSLRLVDPTSFKEAQKTTGVSTKHIQAQAEKVLHQHLPHHFMSTLMTGEVIGAGRTPRHRPYRITDALAIALCSAFEGTEDILHLKSAADRYFSCDPAAGPAHTRPLRPEFGNQIRLM